MSGPANKDKDKERAIKAFEEMYEELYEWREKHPKASFDEIVSQITPRRRGLMGELAAQLARQHGTGEVVEGLICEECGGQMEYKGEPKRDVEHFEGDTDLKRAYYYCPHCEGGISPPGPGTEVDEA